MRFFPIDATGNRYEPVNTPCRTRRPLLEAAMMSEVLAAVWVALG